MKEKSNNEIDLLLRRLSRQDGLRRDGEARDSQLGQHLDVDELSSYAENALPAAARARYTEHLADCSTCRKLVTELSLSLGATAAASAPAETVPMPGGLKQFLASLFSPMVLRYAVPALGLLVVAVIGFVTLRQEDQRGSVAQINPEQQERVPVTAMPSAPAGESPAAGAIDPKREGANANAEDRAKETAPRSASASGEPAGTGPVLAAPPIRREQTLADAPPTVEAEPAPPRPAKAAEPAETEQQKNEAAAKKQSDAFAVETKKAEISTTQSNERARGTFQRAPQPATGRDYGSKAKDAPAARTGSASSTRILAEDAAQSEKDDAATRTVAGRRFRKERGIWTDTAYDSSTATVNVARGSEQFRALVADEPEIKKIAEQLDGEVIVVWKGRAYRIR